MLFRNIQTWTFKSKNKYIMEKNSIKVEFILLGKRIHVLWCWKDLFVCTNDANCKIIQQNIQNNQAIFYIVYSAEKRDIFAIWSSHKMPVLNIIEHFFSNETISNKHVWNTARAYCFYSDNDVWEKKLPNFRQCKINWNIVKCPNIWIVLNFSNYTCHLHTLLHIQLFAFSGNDIVLMENK